MIAAHQQQRRRRDHRGRAGRQRRGLVDGHHAAGRYGPRGRLPGEAADRRGTRPGAHRSGLDRRPGHPQPRPRLPGQHGHLPVQPRTRCWTPWRRPTTAISARRSSRPRCAPATCRSTCSTATGRTSARSSRSTRPTWSLASPEPPFDLAVGRRADLHAAPASCRPRGSTGPTVRGSLVADGCVIEEGAVIENSIIGLRCLIGRNVTIRNSILMGNDFYEAAGRDCRGQAATAGRRWASAAARTSKARSSTRTAASAATSAIVNAQGVDIDRRDRLRHDPRRHRGDSQGRHAARRLVDVELPISFGTRGLGEKCGDMPRLFRLCRVVGFGESLPSWQSIYAGRRCRAGSNPCPSRPPWLQPDKPRRSFSLVVVLIMTYGMKDGNPVADCSG